jgi:hypothetical protein
VTRHGARRFIPKHRTVTVNRSEMESYSRQVPHFSITNYLMLVVLTMSVGASALNKGAE